MDRKNQKSFFCMAVSALLVVVVGMLAGCGGGGGGGAVPAAAPGAFVLSAPSGTGIVPTPTLSWTAASGASLYTVQVTTNSTFSTITTYESTTVTATSVILSGLSPNTTYYWRVTAHNAAGTTASTPASQQFTTMKSGALVWAQAIDPSAAWDDEAYGVAVDTNAVYVVGYDSNTLKFDDQWRIEKRVIEDGSLMPSFGISGVVVSNPSDTTLYSFDNANAIAIDSSFMYVVGYDAIPDMASGASSLADDEWRIEKRHLGTGALDSSFGSAGIVVSNPSLGIDEASAIAIDAQYMYVVGYDTTATRGKEWRIEKRLLSTGALANTFGPLSDGIVTSDPSAQSDKAQVIAIDGTHMFVAGYESAGSGLWQWRLEKRRLDTGGMDTGFGPLNDGVVTIPTVTGDSIISAVAVDAQYVYIAGYVTLGSGNSAWQIEKRDKLNGSLSWSQVSDPGIGYDDPKTIFIDSNYIYVAGYDTVPGEQEWRIEKRNLSDGLLATSFATGGVYQSHPSSSLLLDDDIWALTGDDSYIYAAGYDMLHGTRELRIEKIVK